MASEYDRLAGPGNADLATIAAAASRYGHLAHAGNGDLATIAVRLPAPPPGTPSGPVASFTYTPPAPVTTDLVTFDGSASVPGDGQVITAWDWLFNVSVTRSGPVVTWRLPSASGSYDARLTVTDSGGGTASTTQVLTI